MPKPDKNNAFKGLILGHKVLQKSSNFFQSDFRLDFEPEIELEEGSIPTHTRGFPGQPGASEQQPKT